MKRKYDTSLYASRIRKIRSVMPLACIAADVIAGFPGETEDDFSETVRFIEGLDISYIHVFSYSPREGTLASKINDVVPDRVKKERSRKLHLLSERKKNEFYLRNKGREANVLFESDHSGGFMYGYTENYLRVRSGFDPAKINQVVRTLLEKLTPENIYVSTDQ
jgi:threonylcarbamoyladenosine tRNA methylthiotransferase MtaB